MTAESLVARLTAWWPVFAAGGALALAGLVAIPLGGWDTVALQSRVVPDIGVGETYVGNRLATSIDEVFLTDEHPHAYSELDPGTELLVVAATMENTTREPQIPLGTRDFYAFTVPYTLALGATIAFGEYEVYLERDGTYLPVLNPGVPDTVLFYFVVPDDRFEVGDEIVIGITDATPEAADIYLGTRWVDTRIAVQTTVAIGDAR